LALDESQVEQLIELQLTKRETLRPLFQQIGEKERALREMLQAGSADAAAVGTLVLEIESLRKQVRATEEAFGSQSRAVLTAEQQEKLATLERALRLEPAAREAVRFQLIHPPQPPVARPDPIEGVSRPHRMYAPR
jgi:Spy/CpxP family protein refolding chaperone